LCIGSKSFVTYPLKCTYLTMATRVVETCSRLNMFVIQDKIHFNINIHILVSSPDYAL